MTPGFHPSSLLPPSVKVALELARAHSAMGAALAVWLGGRLAGATWELWWVVPMGVAFLLSAAGNAFNDAHDVAIDRINRPTRPIPRGAATPTAARHLAYSCALLAMLLALPFGLVSTLGTFVSIILLLLYTTHLKAIPLVGNAVASLLTGMALGYGGLLGGDVSIVVLPAATFALLFGGRELLKTIHDLPGDRANALRTVATVAGPRIALSLATLCFVAAMISLAVWVASQSEGWGVLVVITGASIGILAPLWQAPTDMGRMERALTWSKVLGLLSLAGLSVVGSAR